VTFWPVAVALALAPPPVAAPTPPVATTFRFTIWAPVIVLEAEAAPAAPPTAPAPPAPPVA
jgi:hypothetical protein